MAYDDNMPACGYTWDYFLGMYGRLTASLGYLMPIVVAAGNHDVGLNELARTNITVDENGPAFFLYFPPDRVSAHDIPGIFARFSTVANAWILATGIDHSKAPKPIKKLAVQLRLLE